MTARLPPGLQVDPGFGGDPPVLRPGGPAPAEADGAAGQVAQAHRLQDPAGPDLAAGTGGARADLHAGKVKAHDLNLGGKIR